VLLLAPADHHVQDLPAFRRAIAAGLGPASDGMLVTFGVVPGRPETGYGYIRKGSAVESAGDAFAVDAFVEKPDPKTAEGYLKDGYLWNSGIFLFRSSALLEEMGRHAPEILDAAAKTLDKASEDLDFLRLDAESFEACPSDSLDYAVMERTDKAAVVPVDMGWNDIGSWSSLWLSGERDEAGNLTAGDVVAMDTSDCLIRSENRLVATYGVKDLVIVETADAVLVAGRDEAQHVKAIVTALKEAERTEADAHQRIYRPWGYFESVHDGQRYQVKHLMVNPGASLSLQMHYHRAEHWVVVQGTAKVTVGEEVQLLAENESVYIPIGSQHRLENPGKVPLSIIEVQSGAYLGEDDIVRFEDVYKRD
jgi:mannose-1-phosphate guanylyltransferase/mannose-6-phosphate isomerase